MAEFQIKGMRYAAKNVGTALGRLEILAIFPLLVLTASSFGFDDIALVTAFGLSSLMAFAVLLGRLPDTALVADAASQGGRAGLVAMLDRVADQNGRDTACFLLQIDDWAVLHERWGHDNCEEIASRVEERLQTALRNGDLLCRLGDSRYGIVLGPLPSARLGLRDTIATRMADSVAEAIPLRGATVRLSASIGHSALIREGADPAGTTFKAAEAALGDAALHAPAAIRAFATGMGQARNLQSTLSGEVESALHDGSIDAWFQPQICARTSALTGMETLARWQHPKHGLLGAKEFFPAVEASGHMPLLGRTMQHKALKALRSWDDAEARIPTLSLNFSVPELRDQSLAKALQDEIARYDLSPSRLVIEITETVAAQTEDDAVIATLQALRAAGLQIDLEGFGLGKASIPTLQQFGVNRVKIDRSFVLGVDVEEEKRQSINAIVAMAQVMGIKTIATGVETPQEVSALRDLGCDVLQGFGLARPMAAGKVADWARSRSAAGKTIRLDDRRA